MGHGLLLAKNQKTIKMGKQAFEGVAYVTESTHDTRAVFTMAISRSIWAIVQRNKAFWAILHRQYGARIPATAAGIEVEKEVTTDRDSEATVLVLRADTNWEAALDSVTKNGKVPLNLCVGTFNVTKKRGGSKDKLPTTDGEEPMA